MAIKDTLTTVTDGFKTQLDCEMLQRFDTYFKLLVEWNEKMNLTAITDEHGVAVKHFADSLTLYNFVDVKKNASIIDVGTGAAFPGAGGRDGLHLPHGKPPGRLVFVPPAGKEGL